MYILKEYDLALENILNNGIRKPNRTGIDTLSLFGIQTRYKIDQYFPLPTKRKIFYKSIFAELLWMISGSTNINDLEKLGSKIWSAWKDPNFEKLNNYQDGDLGPIYGFSFRNFGGDYKTKSNGFDQISYLVNELKNNKYSRRALINLWDPNVMTTSKVRLPTCHYSFQICVDNQDRMTGILTQRSNDYPIGSPANIYFYSAFMYMIGQQTNLQPYELVYNSADSHIYVNQVDAVKEYLSRPEVDSPKLNLIQAKDIFSYTLDNFQIVDYKPLSPIKIPVAV